MIPWVDVEPDKKAFFLEDSQEILDWWDFFLEGLRALNEPNKANLNMSPEMLFKALNRTLQGSLTEKGKGGVVMIFNGKEPFGWTFAYPIIDEASGQRGLFVHSMYSRHDFGHTTVELTKAAEEYAREFYYDFVETATPRLTGAARRLFFNKLGFKPKYVIFRKELV
jgi:hypothetical protein